MGIHKLKSILANQYYIFRCNYKKKRIPQLCEVNREKAVKDAYFCVLWKKPDLQNPRTFNEKIQVLKLRDYYNNDVITKCIDKYLVKEYMQERGYGDLCAKVYGVYKDARDIDWDILPSRFVIKCNHGCGYNLVCKNKEQLDKSETIEILDKWMHQDYWKQYAEFQYAFVDKKIIIEEYLGDDLETYKFMCFHGEPKIISIKSEVEGGEALSYFDIDWNLLEAKRTDFPRLECLPQKPDNLDEMLQISRNLSKDFPFVRVDLYYQMGEIYFSELTFIPSGGYMPIEPVETLVKWGSYLEVKGLN